MKKAAILRPSSFIFFLINLSGENAMLQIKLESSLKGCIQIHSITCKVFLCSWYNLL